MNLEDSPMLTPGSLHKLAIGALAIAFLLVSPALAHHGWTGYDEQKTLTLTGVIQESAYDNPHATVRLQTEGKTWVAVLAPPSRMESRGLQKDALKAGGTATVVGYPSKSNPDELRVERITIAGKTTELR
jgi:hypothetical protein